MTILHFCIFSFNRGQFLQNCVNSITHCAPDSSISIYDDGSTDAETVGILKALSQTCQVHHCRSRAVSKHGGLSVNMQQALADRADEEIVCFLQDDMQLIRTLQPADFGSLQAYFSGSGQHGFLQPAMLKASRRKRDQLHTVFEPSVGVYFRCPTGASAGVSFSDVNIFSVERLRECDWTYEGREADRENRAAQLFGKMGFMRNPFVMWLPAVPAWRGKVQTRALKIAEKLQRSGFYPFEQMSAAEELAFVQRDVAVLPVAEDFLSLAAGHKADQAPRVPWRYHPLERQRLLKWLNQLELSFRS